MAGKTYLSCTVIEQARTAGQAIFAFLSYTLSSTTSALSVVQSLIFQLASSHENLQAVLSASGRGDLKCNIDSATSLLMKLLACAGPVYVIIDGLDEIEESERHRFMKQLLHVLESCKHTKILVSSRPEADILETFGEKATTIRVDQRNAGSIQAFVTGHIQRWFKEREFLPEAQAEIESLLAPLASTSKGMM